MRKITGEIHLLGNFVMSRGITEYSIIEIGDTILHDMYISSGLDNFLQRGLEQGGISTIYSADHRIMGVHLANGKLYCQGEPFGPTFFSFWIILSIFAIPLFGLGLVSLWQAYQTWKIRSNSQELQAMGGIIV